LKRYAFSQGILVHARYPADRDEDVRQHLAHDPELKLSAFRLQAVYAEDQTAVLDVSR